MSQAIDTVKEDLDEIDDADVRANAKECLKVFQKLFSNTVV